VKTVASKFASAYGKRVFLVATAVLAALVAAKCGHHSAFDGFFDGG
jgi:hypothetical protein